MGKNWVVVYIGNLIGGLLVGAGVAFSHQPSLFNNGMAVSVLSTAASKCSMPFSDAFIKGILCNFLVCIAVWISFAAKEVVSKIVGLFFPIMMFVLCGFEHSIANMTIFSVALISPAIQGATLAGAIYNATYVQAATDAGVDLTNLTWGNFFSKNLLPVTLGNIVGGAICVGCAYWFIYLRKAKKAA